MEIGMWRVEYHGMKAKAEYLRKIHMSEPVEEFNRNQLYSTKTKLISRCSWYKPQELVYFSRKQFIDTQCLTDKMRTIAIS